MNTRGSDKEGNYDRVVNLYRYGGMGVIMLCESRVTYSNQTGGYSCDHPEVEGVYVPLNLGWEGDYATLKDHFTGPKWGGWCNNGIDDETADFVDNFLPGGLKVDRSRLKDSHEAWIYVVVSNEDEDNRDLAYWWGFSHGVLTWENSD